MAFSTSLFTFSFFTSPLTVHPCTISGNSNEPVLSLPNFSFKIFTMAPFGFMSSGSFPAGKKYAGDLIYWANLLASPPKKFSRPRDGCIPPIAIILSI